MFLHLNFLHRPIFESPTHDIRVWTSSFYFFGFRKGAVEIRERGEFDEVPDLREVGGNERAFEDGGGGGNGGLRHFSCGCWTVWREEGGVLV